MLNPFRDILETSPTKGGKSEVGGSRCGKVGHNTNGRCVMSEHLDPPGLGPYELSAVQSLRIDAGANRVTLIVRVLRADGRD
jgi:hypothetical protein